MPKVTPQLTVRAGSLAPEPALSHHAARSSWLGACLVCARTGQTGRLSSDKHGPACLTLREQDKSIPHTLRCVSAGSRVQRYMGAEGEALGPGERKVGEAFYR